MLQPIQKDHESCCPNCGCVLAQIEELSHIQNQPDKIITPNNIDMFLLGGTLEKNVKHLYPRSSQQLYQERTLFRLHDIIREFSLPESLAIDAYSELKRKRRGFKSEKEPIKQLIKELSKDDNYLYFPKIKLIKVKYETILNR